MAHFVYAPDPPQRDGPAHLLDDLRRVLQHRQRRHAGPAPGARARAIDGRREPAALDAQPGAGGLRLLDLGHARGLFEHGRDPGQRHGSAGWLEPGESITVPVYYAGMQQPWIRGDQLRVQPRLSTPRTTRRPSIGAACEASLQPPGISTTAWSAIFSGLDDPDRRHLGRLRDDAR